MTLWALGLIAVNGVIVGGIVDYLPLSNQKRRLQGIADRAALVGNVAPDEGRAGTGA